MRLQGKIAVVVGAGQIAGDTVGNGRATAMLFAREGAAVLAVDRDPDSVEETRRLIAAEGGTCSTHVADVTDEAQCAGVIRSALERYGRIDVLHNNVGTGSGDLGITRMTEQAWERIFSLNLTSVMVLCKHALPLMREQGAGVITNTSSVASLAAYPTVAYKVSKAALNSLTQSVALSSAKYGVRCNAILPGLMDTPMGIETNLAARTIARDDLIAERNASVPLRHRMGTAWDVANAAVFLASDEAGFITGALLPVDGGQSLKIG